MFGIDDFDELVEDSGIIKIIVGWVEVGIDKREQLEIKFFSFFD